VSSEGRLRRESRESRAAAPTGRWSLMSRRNSPDPCANESRSRLS
jgi:hypothetical protein